MQFNCLLLGRGKGQQYLDREEEDGITLWSAVKPLSDSNGTIKSISAIKLNSFFVCYTAT